MSSRNIVHAAVLLLTGVIAAACQYSPEISERALSYNRAIADSTNSLFLLNAVRASRREPTFYSRITSNTATSGTSPSVVLTDPLGKAGTTSFGALGAITGSMLSTTAKGLQATLGVTEQNQLTLQNLDDQNYITGLMSPVSLQILSHFQKQGWNFEELSLMYFGDIHITRGALRNLPNAVAEHCAAYAERTPGVPRNRYCAYFFGDGPPANLDAVRAAAAAHPLAAKAAKNDVSDFKFSADQVRTDEDRGSVMDPACFDRGTISATLPSEDMKPVPAGPKGKAPVASPNPGLSDAIRDEILIFSNDPALDAPDLASPATRTMRCFQQVLRTLLALELQIGTNTQHKLQYRLPLSVVQQNPRYLADLSQQSFEVAMVYEPVKDGAKPARAVPIDVAVCKKDESLALKLAKDSYVTWALGIDPKSGDAAGPRPPGGDQPPQSLAVTAGGNSSCADQTPPVSGQGGGNDAPKPITLTPRSLEGMVYFIGQNIRRDAMRRDRLRHNGAGNPSVYEPVAFLNAGRMDGAYEFERLFVVETGLTAVPDSFVEIEHEHEFYSVPQICRSAYAAPDCMIEFPDHASMQILTLLNQVWGLQKAAASLPTIPTVTVINP
ncbi:MAG: hypothetical protein WDN08_17170 [Rhizomicrobium sp.]